jgi:streptomycin 6-kinase
VATLTRWVGPDAESWLQALPRLSARISRKWELEFDQLLTSGSTSLVIAARSATHGEVVLKVPYPDTENQYEPDALAEYGGEGAVRLLEFDRDSRAMLLERALPGTSLSELSDLEQAVGIACQLLVRLRREVRRPAPIPRCSDFLEGWLTSAAPTITSCSNAIRPALALAVELGRRLVANTTALWLVNRDAHLGNIVRSQREEWLLIDPKPMLGEPAFEGGFLLLNAMAKTGSVELAPTRRLLAAIAANLGVAPERVLAWALVRAFDNAAWARSVEEDPTTWESRAVLLARLS